MSISVAGFVDVGFVRAAVAAACGLEPSQVRLDAEALVRKVDQIAGTWSGTRLRVYWYDGAHSVEDSRHLTQRRYLDAVAATPGVQLRLGHIVTRTPAWHADLEAALAACGVERSAFDRHFRLVPEVQQKGVDTLMVLDLVRLAQRGAYGVAVLFSGDRDISEAVRAAQDEGRRVVLVVPNARSSAPDLRALADEVVVMDHDELRGLHRAPTKRPDPARPAAAKAVSTHGPEDRTSENGPGPQAPTASGTAQNPTPPEQPDAAAAPEHDSPNSPGPAAETTAPDAEHDVQGGRDTGQDMAGALFGTVPDVGTMADLLFGPHEAESPDMAGELFGDLPDTPDVADQLFGSPPPVWGAQPTQRTATFPSA